MNLTHTRRSSWRPREAFEPWSTGEVLSTLRIVVHGETLGGSDAEVEASPPDADDVLIDAVDVVQEEERVRT